MKLYELIKALRDRAEMDKPTPLLISELADALDEIDERLASLERRLLRP